MSMPGEGASESELRERLTAILCATPPLMRVLSVARHLSLPDWLVFSGAVYQPVINLKLPRFRGVLASLVDYAFVGWTSIACS
jgi:hypothetical protein